MVLKSKTKTPKPLHRTAFSKPELLIFVLVFALIGGYILITSFAVSSTANLWVDPDGGTCSRSVVPASYNDSTACGSLAAAYAAMRDGDTVLVKDGSYPGQFIQATNTNLTGQVTIQAEHAGAASFSGIPAGGSHVIDVYLVNHLKLSGFAVPGGEVSVSSNLASTPVTDDTIDNFTGKTIRFSGNVANSSVTNSIWDSGDNNQAGVFQPYLSGQGCVGGDCNLSNINIIGNTFKNVFRSPPGNPDQHTECVQMGAVGDITGIVNIKKNLFYNCDATADLAVNGSATWYIEQNWCGGGGDAAAGISLPYSAKATVYVLYNSCTKPILSLNPTPAGIWVITGNYAPIITGGSGGCYGTMTYNLSTSPACPGVGNKTVSSLDFVDASNNDFHLKSSANAIDQAGNGCTGLTDTYGINRPQGLACDAGAAEYSSTSAPSGDCNGDNTVDGLDISSVLVHWRTNYPACDFNNDSIVDGLDLSTILVHWGQAVSGQVTVAPPLAPTAYTLPTTAVSVSTTAQLIAAAAGSTRDIIIENGDYTYTSYVAFGDHRLWARNLGGATLHFGITLGGNSSTGGGEVHGLKFNVNNASLGLEGADINIWGDPANQNQGGNITVADTWLSGNGVMSAGLMDRQPNGLKAQRLVVDGFQGYGVFYETYFSSSWDYVPTTEPVVSDLNITNIFLPTPGSGNGTEEAGLWSGTNCLCSRIKIRNIGWMGIWTGANANNGVYSDLDIDQITAGAQVAVYMEHYSRGNVFKNFVFGSPPSGAGLREGVNCEWADPNYAGTNPVAGQSIAACHFNTFQDGTIYTHDIGIGTNDGEGTTIKNIKFVGQKYEAIDEFDDPGFTPTDTWQNQGNDFTGLQPGAVPYSNAYPQS